MLLWEGTIKRRAHDQAWGLLLLSSGCFDTSVWVFNKPQTLYFGCLSATWVGSISRMHSVICFSICMCIQTYLEDFELLWLHLSDGRQGRPLHPPLEPGIERSTDHNPSDSKLQGWDKLLVWCESLPVYLVYLCHPLCGPVTYIYIKIYICMCTQRVLY